MNHPMFFNLINPRVIIKMSKAVLLLMLSIVSDKVYIINHLDKLDLNLSHCLVLEKEAKI